jgi:peptidyl-tRNA hydrolase, PTH1 family
MENLYLIVGLGNPGREYARTRHNAGFLLADKLAERWRAQWAEERKFRSHLAGAVREGMRMFLCKPQTFMNLSGDAVGPLAGYYQVPPERILVIVDDADLPFGIIRLRPKGSSGGHHGLESIERRLGTRDFPRLRIGIGAGGRTEGAREITRYVLGAFGREDAGRLEKVLTRAADQVECWLSAGIEKAMNQFNGAVEPAPQQEKSKNE